MVSLRWLGLSFGLLAGCSDVTGPPTVISQTVPLIGGQPDTTTRGVVGLVVENTSGCTGSLLAPNLVLTARHCVANISSSNGTVQCGVTTFGQTFSAADFVVTPDDNLRNGVPAGAQYGATRVVTTPGNMVCGNDVALLILSSNISSATAPTIVPRLDTPVATNEEFDAVGYGITDPNDLQGATFGQRLRVNGLGVLCVGTACANLGGSRTEWGAVTPVCSGDSGGPALDTSGRVIGVASRGNSDCDSALYGSVSSWASLIRDTAIDAAEAGGYAPPTWAGATTTDGGTPDSGTPDSGTPDSGTPDSGTPDAGNPVPDSGAPDAGNPLPDSGMPEPDAGGTIGEPCTTSCGGDLACYLPENRTQGICVPRCSAADTTCPLRYECSARLGICVPGVPDEQVDDADGGDDDNRDSGGCGCRAATRPDGSGGLALAFLMLVGVARRRRRD